MAKIGFKSAVRMGAALGMLAASAVSASAEYIAPVESKRNEFRAGVGLQWNFGDNQPQFVISGRWTETRPSDSVVGARVDIAIPFMADFRPTVRLLGLAGNRDVQGEAGFGYRFASSDFILGLGVQGPYVNAGINYAFAKSVTPYIGVNTFGRAPAPKLEAIEILR